VIEELDLVTDVPDLFLQGEVARYLKRTYLGQALTQSETQAWVEPELTPAPT
jgi:hypothetical protein